MKETFKQIEELDKSIEQISGVISRTKKEQSDFGIALGFTGNQELRTEVEKLESKLREKKKERLNKLETLLKDVQFEIGMSNSDLKVINPELEYGI